MLFYAGGLEVANSRFPSPRYPSSAPAPSLLSRISPFPYPTPWPVPRSPQPLPDPLPLNASELHIRLILQSLADQITEIWHAPGDHSTHGANGTNGASDSEPVRTNGARAIPARDFMYIRVPSHELSESEIEEAEKAREEAERIMAGWKADGGVWMDEEGGRRWIGAEDAPES